MSQIKFVIESENIAQRIDKFLVEQLKDMSRSHIQDIIDQGVVTVGTKVIKSNYKLRVGDVVTVDMPDVKELDLVAEAIPLDIVFEDKDLIIINKPKGMVVHPAPGNYDHTLVNALMHHCKGDLSGINGVMRPGIVHRIDKDTSGLLMVCKNDLSHRFMAEQFKEHTISRKYYALVYGNVKESEGTINAPIGRHKINRLKNGIDWENGKEAITHYRVMEYFNGCTLIECQLETGRTHQIRVHFASMHHPLVGDKVYGPLKARIKFDGQALHAKTLGFTHPVTKKWIELDSELPTAFLELLDKLRKNRGFNDEDITR